MAQRADKGPAKVGRERLDHLLTARGLAESGEKARALIMAGAVLVNGRVSDKPGAPTPADAAIEIKGSLPYVSRGGLKLEAALDAFGIAPAGLVVADIGASTGGFTDCVLQRGATRVYAIDVGYGQLAWSLRQDRRVTVMERTNIRYLEALPEPADLATIDVSFISLALVLPAALRLLGRAGRIVALIKPQFEAGRDDVGKGGVVREPAVHRRVLMHTLEMAAGLGLHALGLIPSPLRGPAGNVEFLAGWARQVDGGQWEPAALADAALMATPH